MVQDCEGGADPSVRGLASHYAG